MFNETTSGGCVYIHPDKTIPHFSGQVIGPVIVILHKLDVVIKSNLKNIDVNKKKYPPVLT